MRVYKIDTLKYLKIQESLHRNNKHLPLQFLEMLDVLPFVTEFRKHYIQHVSGLLT